MTSTINSKNTLVKEALRSEIAWNAVLREVRSRNASVGVVSSGDLSLTRKKRSRFDHDEEDAKDMSLTGATSEKKVRCHQPGSSNNGTATFLDLSPPSSAASLTSPIRFTFGKHYTKITLPSTVKASCGCVLDSKFDVFSAYRCPCKSRSMTSSQTKTTTSRPTPSKGRKYDAI